MPDSLPSSTSFNPEFNVDTEMKDVEIIHVTSTHVLAKGKRFGRLWLLRGLSPEKRNSTESLRQLREEFCRRFSRIKPGMPLTVGLEEIQGLGPCIVEEWSETPPPEMSEKESGEIRKRKSSGKKILVLIALLFLLAASLGAAYHIHALSTSFEAAKTNLEALRLSKSEGEKRMVRLADSLDRVLRTPLIPEEFGRLVAIREMDKEERMALALYRERAKEFDNELVRYDRRVIPHVIDSLPLFYDSIHALYRHMLIVGKDVDPSGKFPLLPEDDRIRLSRQLYACYMARIVAYSKVWMPKAQAAYARRKEKVVSKDEHSSK